MDVDQHVGELRGDCHAKNDYKRKDTNRGSHAAMTGIGAFWLLIVGLIAHGTAKDIWTLSSDGLYAVLFGAFFPSAMNLIIFAKSSKLLGPRRNCEVLFVNNLR